MQASSASSQEVTPYEHRARDAALIWSQSALTSAEPAFDIQSSEHFDLYGTIVASHQISVEHPTRRWYGRVVAGSDDILCASRDELNENLSQQGRTALYDSSVHADLKQKISSANYATFCEPSLLPIHTKRLLYRYRCDSCQASGTQTCYACRGNGETSCGGCSGGNTSCGSCGGSGTQTSQNDDGYQSDNCPGCGGSGHHSCSSCSGSGYISCDVCGQSGLVKCEHCNGTGSFTEIGNVALRHTPRYQATLDQVALESAQHVMNYFGSTTFAEHANVTFDSINQINESSTSITLVFQYRFELSACLLKVKTREDINGNSPRSQWTVAGHTPQVIDCQFALSPVLANCSLSVSSNTDWRFFLRRNFNQRVKAGLAELLTPAVHRWIINGANQNLNSDAICMRIGRGLDPSGINSIIAIVSRALTLAYRRRLFLHQALAMVITAISIFIIKAITQSAVPWPLPQGYNYQSHIDVVYAGMFILPLAVVLSFYFRHRAWLKGAGGNELRARAEKLGHLKVVAPSLYIAGAALIVALAIKF